AGVAVARPGSVFPRVVAEFARAWNGVERPEEFAGMDVIGAHIAFGVVVRYRRHALLERGADNDDVFDHERTGVQPSLARLQTDLIPGAFDHAALPVDHAALTE